MTFILWGEPVGKGRPRFWQGHAVTPPKTKAYENEVARIYKMYGGEMMSGPVRIAVTAWYRIPKSASKKLKHQMEIGEVRPTKKPDIDNVMKIIMDGLTGVAYEDDKQVVEFRIDKFYDYEPKVTVLIEEDQ